MKAVAATDVILRAAGVVRLPHRVDHRGMHVGEAEVFLRCQMLVDVAEVGKRVVVGDVRRLLPHHLAGAKEIGVHRTGRAHHHRLHAGLVEACAHLPHVGVVGLADLGLPGLVAAVVHAVAEGGDGGVEDGQVVEGPPREAVGPLARPAELHHLHVGDAGAGEQPALDVFAVEPLLGDRVPDHGDASRGEERRLLGAGGRGDGERRDHDETNEVHGGKGSGRWREKVAGEGGGRRCRVRS